MDRVMAMRPNWGIVFFRYDWFSAIRTEMVKQVRQQTKVQAGDWNVTQRKIHGLDE
jgi:hypothetical protein